MPFNASTKKTLNVVVPVGATGVAMAFLYKQGEKDWRKMLLILVLVFLFSWLIVSQITKALLSNAEKPDHVNVPPDAAGGVDANFDPTALTDRLYTDIYAPWYVWRDADLYATLDGLSNASLIKVYNDWTDRYFSKDSESMVAAMNGEVYGITTATATHAQNIINRLKNMGAN